MANFVTDNYRLDITPQGSYPVVYLSQFEDGRQITFRILNRGANFVIPSGISAFASGLKPNGGYYEHVCTIDDTRKYVTMPVEADMTDIKGKGVANIVFTNSSQEKVISAKFIVNVQQTVSDNGIVVPTEAETIFQQILDEIRAAASTINVNVAELESQMESLESNVTQSVDELDARMETFIAGQTGTMSGTKRTETVLFESDVPCVGNVLNGQGFIDLLSSYLLHDYLEIHYNAFGKTHILRCKPEDISVSYASSTLHWSETQFFNSVVVPPATIDPNPIREMLFSLAYTETGTQLVVEVSVWAWNGQAGSTGHLVDDSTFYETWDSTNNVYVTSGFTGGIYKIVGIKYEDVGTDKDAELVDIRVGADGTVYTTAGEAVRAQASQAITIVGTGLYIGDAPIQEDASQDTSN